MNEPQPVLSAEPWYTSAVQRAAVLSIITGMAAVIIDLFGLSVDAQIVNGKIALVGQLVSLGFTGWAIIKRSKSNVAPLTLSAGGAALRNSQNPPLLEIDPTKGVHQ